MTYCDKLWPGGPDFLVSESVFAPGTDSFLLGAFANMTKVRHCADLCCGSGFIAVLLAVKNTDAVVDAVDIDPNAVELCRENFRLNALNQARVIHGDLREYRVLFPPGRYDLVTANPPYFPKGGGKMSTSGSGAARTEIHLELSELCAAAGYLCRQGGAFALVYRPERLSELFTAMTAAGIEPKRLLLTCPKPGSAPNLVLVEGRRGGKPGLRIEPPLPLTDGSGAHSDQLRRIYDGELFVRGATL